MSTSIHNQQLDLNETISSMENGHSKLNGQPQLISHSYHSQNMDSVKQNQMNGSHNGYNSTQKSPLRRAIFDLNSPDDESTTFSADAKGVAEMNGHGHNFGQTNGVVNGRPPVPKSNQQMQRPARLQTTNSTGYGTKGHQTHSQRHTSKVSSGYGSSQSSDGEQHGGHELHKHVGQGQIGAGGKIVLDSAHEEGSVSKKPSAETPRTIASETYDHFSTHDAIEVIKRMSRLDDKINQTRKRQLDKNRRRSAPANLRDVFSDELLCALRTADLCFELDNEHTSGRHHLAAAQRVNHPETVVQLARKFSAQSAMQSRLDAVLQNVDANRLEKMLAQCNDERLKKGIQARLQQINTTCGHLNNGQMKPKAASNPPTPVRPKDAPDFRRCASSSKHLGGIASLQYRASANAMQRQGSASAGGSVRKVSTRSPSAIKEALLRWCQIKTRDYYPQVDIQNFSSSWANGMAFCALIHHFYPDAFDFQRLNPNNRKSNFELAFRVADEKADIMPLLEVEDMLLMGDRPDWKCVFTYVQCFYVRFKDVE